MNEDDSIYLLQVSHIAEVLQCPQHSEHPGLFWSHALPQFLPASMSRWLLHHSSPPLLTLLLLRLPPRLLRLTLLLRLPPLLLVTLLLLLPPLRFTVFLPPLRRFVLKLTLRVFVILYNNCILNNNWREGVN